MRSATSANLVFTPAANANGTAYASFTFQVRDDGGTANGGVDLDQSANTFTINVTSVNDAPAGTDSTVTIIEDASHTFAAADFGFSDPNDDPANGFLSVVITTLPAAGTPDPRRRSGRCRRVDRGQPTSATWSSPRPPTPTAPAYASFTFQVRDDGGTANGGVDLDPSANTFTINVTSVNDAPAGTDSTVTIIEDAGHTFTAADFGFSDPSTTPPTPSRAWSSPPCRPPAP